MRQSKVGGHSNTRIGKLLRGVIAIISNLNKRFNDSLCVRYVFYELVWPAAVAAMISDTLLFSSLPLIYPCILDCEALFLIYIHNMDTIIHPISRRSHTLGSVSVRWNNDLHQLASVPCDVCIYLYKPSDSYLLCCN